MHIHILGICGTFMGGLAAIARQMGHRVSGSDAQVYPPMSTQLEQLGITLCEGYSPEHLSPAPDIVMVGNAMVRGNPAVEYMLNERLNFTSGPQWLGEQVLKNRTVLAVTGTHGKTTTTSMLAWMLEQAGLAPGFLIGGVPGNFDVSARLGDGEFFVIEADEYDTAFFDKRSKFVHYHPQYLAINNLEFDHADIFLTLGDIQRQFHHLIRTVPATGEIVINAADDNIRTVLDMGSWTPVVTFSDKSAVWHAQTTTPDFTRFVITHEGKQLGEAQSQLMGQHNMLNYLAASALAYNAGASAKDILDAIATFTPPKRRLELKTSANDIFVYDDFAHHPTAISSTLTALRAHHPQSRLVAVFEPRSNTMKMGMHNDDLAAALLHADRIYVLVPKDSGVQLQESANFHLADNIDALFDKICQELTPGDRVCVMSNGAFGGMSTRLARVVAERSLN